MKRYEILRDGKVVATVEGAGDACVMAWFHWNTSQSMTWAMREEGYTVREAPEELPDEPDDGSRDVDPWTGEEVER